MRHKPSVTMSLKMCFVTLLVFFSVVQSLSALDNTCGDVKREFQKLSSSAVVPDTPVIDESLRICSKTLTASQASCCTQDTELEYLKSAEQYMVHNIRHRNDDLRRLITDHMKDYQEKVLALGQHAQNSTGQKLSDWYSVPISEHQGPIGNLFSDIDNFLKLNAVTINASVENFFNNIFPVIFKNVIYRRPSDSWTHHYHHCLARHRLEIVPKPFGKYPQDIAVKLSNGLMLARAYLEAMNVVIETINTTDHLLLEDECKHAVTRLQYCSHCHGFVDVKPCKGFCLDVMRGCLSKVAEIGPEWNDIISAVEGLVREMSEKSMDDVFSELIVGISDAIMHAMVSAPEFYQQVHEKCGIPLEAGETTEEVPTPNFSRTQNLPSPVTGPLSMDVMRVTLDLVDSKGLFSHLADDICSETTTFEQDMTSGTCWNGTAINVYVRDVVDLDILSQARNNPEVKVSLMLDPQLRQLKDKMTLINLKLQSHIRKTDRHRPRNFMIADDPDTYEYSSDEGTRSGTIETVETGGPVLTDDEDLYKYSLESGSGSGEGSPDVDLHIPDNRDYANPEDPGQRPYLPDLGNLGPDRPTTKQSPPNNPQRNYNNSASGVQQNLLLLFLSVLLFYIINQRR